MNIIIIIYIWCFSSVPDLFRCTYYHTIYKLCFWEKSNISWRLKWKFPCFMKIEFLKMLIFNYLESVFRCRLALSLCKFYISNGSLRREIKHPWNGAERCSEPSSTNVKFRSGGSPCLFVYDAPGCCKDTTSGYN